MGKSDMEKKAGKAGIILFDRGERPKMNGHWHEPPGLKVLATYTEGRFADDGVYFVPPKGSIDPCKVNGKIVKNKKGEIVYETPLEAAVRECREETGMDLQRLLGTHFADFMAGKTIEHVESTGYPGVEIVSASPTAVRDHVYVSGHGKEQQAQYFAIEVKGIDKLEPHLKNLGPELSSKIARAQGLPSFQQMMEIIRTGVVPVVQGAVWSSRKEKVLFKHPRLPELEQQWLKAHHAHHEHFTPDEWQAFISDQALGKADYKALHQSLETLKEYLEGKSLIGDCDNCLKLDTRDRPLKFYKEGGKIMRASKLITAMEVMAEKNGIYARAVWGEYRGDRKADVDEAAMMQRSQISAFIDFLAEISPMEVASAAIRLPFSFAHFNAGNDDAPLAPRALRTVTFGEAVIERRKAAANAEKRLR